MIEVDTLAEAFARHVGSCRSASIVCALPIAVESWFRVELVPALIDVGVSLEHVSFNFTYAGTRDKADIAVIGSAHSAVFELKSFVCSADANKIEKFPKQIARLESLVQTKVATQGIAFCTFFGYTNNRLEGLCKGFFPSSWHTTQVRLLREAHPLRFMLASFHSN